MELERKTSDMTNFNGLERGIIDVKSETKKCDLKYLTSA